MLDWRDSLCFVQVDQFGPHFGYPCFLIPNAGFELLYLLHNHPLVVMECINELL